MSLSFPCQSLRGFISDYHTLALHKMPAIEIKLCGCSTITFLQSQKRKKWCTNCAITSVSACKRKCFFQHYYSAQKPWCRFSQLVHQIGSISKAIKLSGLGHLYRSKAWCRFSQLVNQIGGISSVLGHLYLTPLNVKDW